MKYISKWTFIVIILFILTLVNITNVSAYHSGITVACPTGSDLISSTSLIASYDMETLRNSKGKDFSVSVDDLTLGGSISYGATVGVFKNATNFDGVFNNLTGIALSTPNSFSVAFYTYPTSSSSSLILSVDGGSTYVSFGIISANKFTFSLMTNLGQTTLTTTNTYSLNVWHSVIVIYDGALMTLRVDGVEISVAKSGTPQTWTELHIGYFETTLYYTGKLDEFEIYSRVLTSAERTEFESIGGACVPTIIVIGPAISVVSMLLLLSACALFIVGWKWPIMWFLCFFAGMFAAINLYTDLQNAVLSVIVATSFIFVILIGFYRILTEPTGGKF